MVAFDPIAIARACRTDDLHLAVERGRAAFEPDGLGNAGQATVAAIVPAFMVGEGALMAAALREALAWIEEAEAGDEQYGDDPRLAALLRKRALGIGRWLIGGAPGRPLWRAASELSAAVVKAEPPAPYVLSDHMLDCLLAGTPERAIAAAALADPEDKEAAAALAIARAAGAPGRDVAAAIGALYCERLDYWLKERVFRRVAMWAMAAWFDTGLATGAEAALLAAYAFLPDVALPPALVARGWTDAPGPVLVPMPAGTTLARLDLAVTALGLARDPDRATPPKGTAFASWTGATGDDGEIDYSADRDQAHVAIRGRRAAMLGNVLATLFGTARAPSPETALADLLTPPPGAAASPNGTLRWHALRAAVAAAGPANATLVRSLAAAGLRDSDWRVRMAAVLATGRLRLADLAEQAMAAPVPAAGTSGLDQEDRRALLALRHAARNLALDLAPGEGIAGERGSDVLGARIAYQRDLRAFIEQPQDEAADRAGAFVAALLGDPAPLGQAAPARWGRWLDRP